MSEKPPPVDFGASVVFGAHLFRVEIPATRNRSIAIFESYGYSGTTNSISSGEERVVLKRAPRSEIADIRPLAKVREICKIDRKSTDSLGTRLRQRK